MYQCEYNYQFLSIERYDRMTFMDQDVFNSIVGNIICSLF